MSHSMKRRKFLKTLGTSSLIMTVQGCSLLGVKKNKPSLLFIWTDEQRADTMAAYGNTKIKTPNLNKLCRESIVFKKAYVSQPVCTPSRSTVMTGLWPHTTGLIYNNIPLPVDVPCLPEMINNPDYRTAYMGKWHLGDEIFRQHGFDDWISIEDNYITHYQEGRDRNKRSDYHHFLEAKGYKPDRKSNNTFSRSFAARRSLEHCKPRFLEDRACEFLRKNQNDPFILYVNFLEPHMPFFGPFDDLHNPEEIDLPANFSDPLEENEPLHYRMKRERDLQKYGKSEKDFRKLIAKYWGLVAQVDRSVGNILKTLDELRLADNTIVVYTSDHGDMMGAHHMVEKGVMYEEAVRIPWIMRVPQLKLKGRKIANPVSHIDMVPTLLELMGKQPDKKLPGQSLVPLMKGDNVDEDHVFIEWHSRKKEALTPLIQAKLEKSTPNYIKASPEEIHKATQENPRAVISPDGWKLCLSDFDKCQLFNLNDDPGETTNLYDSGKYDDVIDRLTEKILDWQQKTKDIIKLAV